MRKSGDAVHSFSPFWAGPRSRAADGAYYRMDGPATKGSAKVVAPAASLYIMGARPVAPFILPERPMRLPRIAVFAATLAVLASRSLSAAEPARPVPPRFSAAYIDRS